MESEVLFRLRHELVIALITQAGQRLTILPTRRHCLAANYVIEEQEVVAIR